MGVVTGLFSFGRFGQSRVLCPQCLQKWGLDSLGASLWIRVQFVDDVRYSLSSPHLMVFSFNQSENTILLVVKLGDF